MLTITASPCLLHGMILAGFNFCLFIYIYVRVCMYKNRALIHCQHNIWVNTNSLQQFLCVCCKKSLNVCGFNKSLHTTENI